MLTVGSLFSGIGGIELGLERTGYFKTGWFVEIDPFCQRVLRKHWPDVPIHGDIRGIDWSAMPRVDMLAGGFPCQDISTANPKGKGIEGPRSGLWKEYAKAIGILRPKYALIENVPAIVRKGLDVVLADLAEAGYDAEWFNLRASDFGALHRRERIFIVAYPHAERSVDGEVGEFANQGGEYALGNAREGTEKEADFTNNRLGLKDGGENARQGGGVGQDTRCENPEYPPADFDGERLNGKRILLLSRQSHQADSRNKERLASDAQGSRFTEGEQNRLVFARKGRMGLTRQTEGRIIADDLRERSERFWQKKVEGKQGFSWCEDVRRVEDLSGRPDIPEPFFRGGRDGVPNWVDRIKACGNAVVPDCAEFIGEIIMEYDVALKMEGD